MRSQHAFRRKADIANLVLALPARAGALDGDVADVGAVAVYAWEDCLVLLVDQIPGHDEGIVATGCEHASLVRRPFDAVEVALVAAELEKGCAWLADVQDADQIAV